MKRKVTGVFYHSLLNEIIVIQRGVGSRVIWLSTIDGSQALTKEEWLTHFSEDDRLIRLGDF